MATSSTPQRRGDRPVWWAVYSCVVGLAAIAGRACGLVDGDAITFPGRGRARTSRSSALSHGELCALLTDRLDAMLSLLAAHESLRIDEFRQMSERLRIDSSDDVGACKQLLAVLVNLDLHLERVLLERPGSITRELWTTIMIVRRDYEVCLRGVVAVDAETGRYTRLPACWLRAASGSVSPKSYPFYQSSHTANI